MYFVNAYDRCPGCVRHGLVYPLVSGFASSYDLMIDELNAIVVYLAMAFDPWMIFYPWMIYDLVTSDGLAIDVDHVIVNDHGTCDGFYRKDFPIW